MNMIGINKMVRHVIEIIAKKIKGNDYILDDNIPITYLIVISIQRISMLYRGKFASLGMMKCGRHLFVGKNVSLKCKGKISVGLDVTIQEGVYIDALSKEGFTLGDGCSIGSRTIIRCSGNYKEIGKGFLMGKNSSLADNCFVGATGGVTIGNDVIGGQNIRFHSSNHNFEDTKLLIRKQGVTCKGIVIGNNCWIGAGVVFCDGVTIGDGCVVGANSVVTKSFPNNSVIVGNPAKTIRKREE